MSQFHQILSCTNSIATNTDYAAQSPYIRLNAAKDVSSAVITQFGDTVDVRKRGALRIMRTVDTQQGRTVDTPAVVRIWHQECCQELTAHHARILANQLLAAADLVEEQNNYPKS